MPAPIEVYYDGGCPICSREIAFYKARRGAERFVWIDANNADPASLGSGLDRETAMARMHVRQSNGKLLTGAAAFAEMWRQMPGLKWLGWLLAIPPFGAIAELAYRGFLLTRTQWR